MKNFLNWILFILTCSGPIADEAEASGLIDRGGQGR